MSTVTDITGTSNKAHETDIIAVLSDLVNKVCIVNCFPQTYI